VAKRISGIHEKYIRRHISRRNCTLSMSKMSRSKVQSHLLARGFDANFIGWEGNGNDSD
jgi:hypothetical protein